jgi:hypothetical protein
LGLLLLLQRRVFHTGQLSDLVASRHASALDLHETLAEVCCAVHSVHMAAKGHMHLALGFLACCLPISLCGKVESNQRGIKVGTVMVGTVNVHLNYGAHIAHLVYTSRCLPCHSAQALLPCCGPRMVYLGCY